MGTSDFLAGTVLALPKERTGDDYELFIETWFREFLDAIDGLGTDDWPTRTLKAHRTTLIELCEAIQGALRHYFKGFPARAYDTLSMALDALSPWLDGLGTKADVSEHLRYLYRARMGSLAEYGRADLFHIPFEKRHLVKPQRYSIPGLPSLYLGGSSWVCWEELSRPAFEGLQVSRYQAVPGSGVRVLDLAYRPAVMSQFAKLLERDLEDETENARFVLSHAICWPLFAACSVRVRHAGSPFVPEYVVPQLLLQWVRDRSHFEGVRYFSTRVAHLQSGDDPEQIQAAATAGANYVFPAVNHLSVGHCSQLVSQFILSAPIAWPLVPNLRDIQDPPSGPPRWSIRLSTDSQVPYHGTIFYRVERGINALPCAAVRL